MSPGRRVSCVLCQRSEETKVTGALSSQDRITAHQNCLLYSSGLFCRYSPEFDDLFGFSVEDVIKEVRRGNKLNCYRCKKKGATAGCEVSRCKRSFHYPCAVQAGAEIIEDPDNGKYGLFCLKHHPERSQISGAVNGSGGLSDHNGAGPSKVHCLTCEKKEGKISLDSLSNNIIKLYCDKHAPSSHKRGTYGDSAAARPSGCNSDSNSSSCSTSKRELSLNQKQESHSKSKTIARRISYSSNSDENETAREIGIFAPLESDIDETPNSSFENQFMTLQQLMRKNTDTLKDSASGSQPKDGNQGGAKDDDEITIDSDAESVSLLPMDSCKEASAGPALSPTVCLVKTPVQAKKRKHEESSPKDNPVHSPDQHVGEPSRLPPSPRPKANSDPGSAVMPAPPETICASLISSSPSPVGPRSGPKLSVDSPSFWKSCNMAGCTQAIFTDFVNEMNDLANKIQSDQASREDYDLALRVMMASGKLAGLVAKQQKALRQKQIELTQAEAAIGEVMSALRQ
ncbi:histone-lysine N-methyltransferase 2A [Echeneis naucrates]|uniref:PHD-type domain-containing protein n=1 Tax=Echeneis naucrates TaxID=173247 RepID=A0A665UXF6_ECHNA|nr:PHD finger protein 11 [Echeneis naucrates]